MRSLAPEASADTFDSQLVSVGVALQTLRVGDHPDCGKQRARCGEAGESGDGPRRACSRPLAKEVDSPIPRAAQKAVMV